MSTDYEATIRHRQIVLLILISVFVVSVVFVTISVLIIAPGLNVTDEYLGPKNILFIVVDDLRPTLGCYGDERAITPNIDQLASKSVLFRNAFSQQALCGPSRTSFLTSRRPDSLHLYDVGSYWRDKGNFTTLPQHFKYHGYETISIGKVFHHGIVSNNTDDYPYSWTSYPYRPPTQKYKMKPVCPSPNGGQMNLICPVTVEDQPLKSLPDIDITNYAVQYLQNKSQGINKTVPFFLAVGYNKPHIPFKFPKEFLDLYPIESMDLAPNHTKPTDLPDISWNPWADLRERDDVKKLENLNFPYGPLPESFQKLARQGYYSSLSYMDDQLGKLLKALEDTGFAAHTTIVLLGDHGWSLGEHQEWSKYSNFEVSVRVPLLVHIPEIMEEKRTPFSYIPVLSQIKNNQSDMNKPSFKPKYETEELVELVDLFPTLAAIAELPIPPLCRIYSTMFCSEGLSFYSLIKHLIGTPWRDFPWKTAVFSQYPRPSLVPQNNSDQPKLKDIKYMGYSIRTAHFRYTEWVEFDNQNFKPNWTAIHARELYDHQTDPFEADNVCRKKGMQCDDEYNNTVIELSKKVRKGWRYAMPPKFFDTPSLISHLL